MKKTVNVYDVKSHLSRLLTDVEDGADVVIARHGRPVARLVRFEPAANRRTPGRFAGHIDISGDFDEFTAADEDAWYEAGA
jgi:prevent-host-death family protein